MSALVFGEADPQDYKEPRCKCGHYASEHWDIHGVSPAGDPLTTQAPCWYGWDKGIDGCKCLRWSPKAASK